jgi:hypothetical protein
MKKYLVLFALAAPVLAFAQSHDPLTRTQVRTDLVAVEQAGYNPAAGSDPFYPSDIQAAEAKIAARQDDAYGGVRSGSSASGANSAPNRSCVGPADFCKQYFGS